MYKKTFTIFAIMALPLVAILTFTPTTVWDGSFRQAEYQLLFVDEDGSPIEGVELFVEDQGGSNYYHYPVTDYVDDSIPRSNADGMMTFHHVSYSHSVEFGGRCQELFGAIRLGECNGPRFVCRFLLVGNEIYRCMFNDLNARIDGSQESVTRKWIWNDCLAFEYPLNPGEDWMERHRKVSDRDGNGTLDIGEGAAYQAAMCAMMKHEDIQRGSPAPSAELEFIAYRTKIVLRDKFAAMETLRPVP